MYGGAAGGGKSDALLMAALQYVDVPGYSAMILRRTYADLAKPGAIMDRATAWLGQTDAHKRDMGKRWEFPGGGTLSFGYVSRPQDVYQYASAEYQFIAWDEGTQFEEWPYKFLFSRLRKTLGALKDVPLRMRMATNPGGIGHEWVKERFVEGQPDIGFCYAQKLLNEDTGEHERRLFIPAKLEDNPHLDAAEYRKQLAMLDPVTRRQLLIGDWNARRIGEYFDREWCLIVEKPPETGMRWVRYWDLAGTVPLPGTDPDYTVGTLVGFHQATGYWYIADVVRFRKNPGDTKILVKAVAVRDGIGVPVRIEQDPGQAGKSQVSSYEDDMQEFDVKGISPSGDKETRFKPFSARASPPEGEQKGKVRVVRGKWNTVWYEELEGFPLGAHDDQADSTSGGYQYLARDANVQQVIYRPGMAEPVVQRGDLTLRGEQYVDKE